jgi:hypothetical protein
LKIVENTDIIAIETANAVRYTPSITKPCKAMNKVSSGIKIPLCDEGVISPKYILSSNFIFGLV